METRINTKSGKLLTVYDDLCPVSLINDIFFQLRSQEYPLVSSNDTALQDFNGVNGFGKTIDVEFIRSILNNIKSPEAFKLKRIVNHSEIKKSWVNLFNRDSPTNRYHADAHSYDSSYLSLLYYANSKWDLEWDGGTVFRTDDLSEVEYLSDYKPGRLILFDSSIPHKIYASSYNAHPYRFTLNTLMTVDPSYLTTQVL
tara:strand:- start:638 stop:1234 length:597 start_codon:yes stop_codon:yes gene_type:complete